MIYCYTYGKPWIGAFTRSCAANYAEQHGNFSRPAFCRGSRGARVCCDQSTSICSRGAISPWSPPAICVCNLSAAPSATYVFRRTTLEQAMLDQLTIRGRLVAAALKLAAERPGREVTLANIAAAAGVSLVDVRREFN